MTKVKKPQLKKPLTTEQILKSLRGEDQMHDDHGLFIIGRRDQKPRMPEENEEK